MAEHARIGPLGEECGERGGTGRALIVVRGQEGRGRGDSFHASSGRVPIVQARTVECLISISRAVPNGLAVLYAHRSDRVSTLNAWRAAQPQDWGTILVAVPNEVSMQATLAWLHEWPLPMIVETETHLPWTAADLLEWEVETATRESCRMMRYLARRLMGARPALAAQLASVFAAPKSADSLKHLALLCHLSERQVRRQLRASGVQSSYLYFAASRVLRAYGDVCIGMRSSTDIAQRHGFGEPRTLRAQWRDVTGAALACSRGHELTDSVLGAIALRVFGA